MKQGIDPDIVKRYFDNTCSEEERKLVEKWLDPTVMWNSDHSPIATKGNPKELIWSGIVGQIHVKQHGRTKMIRFTRYVAAAAVLLFVTFSAEDNAFFAVHTDSDALKIEKLYQAGDEHPEYTAVDVYRVSNEANTAVHMTTKANGRVYKLAQNKTYLTVRLEGDPGVVGDQILVLSPEQLEMIPDVPLARQLATVVNREERESTTLNYL
ncbi:hypothetical protein [Sphingobacterium sp. LRF_L2]|uniref:hypothetical protein n=1 Tax=Sphingobacterium sp. LRF_L2 TaxID=3369421 RepID=UPI003F621A3E